MTTTILDTIKKYKLEEIEQDKKLISTGSIEDLAKTLLQLENSMKQ